LTVVYRLTRRIFAANPFDGEGSYRFGGRWSSPGTRLTYAAEHLSLAMVEYLAHLDPNDSPEDLVLARAEVPENVSRIRLLPPDLPDNWRVYPAPEFLGSIGDKFIAEAKVAVLIVPSVLAPSEDNWLLNPAHPDFQRIVLLPVETFKFDWRLV
jgi:RES domain-containing protein